MRLLHVVPSFFPAHSYGGPIVSLHRLACEQVRQGLDVRVLTSDASGLPDQSRLAGLAGRWVTEHGVPTRYARTLGGPARLDDLSPEMGVLLPGLLRWADLVHVTAVFSPSSMMAMFLSMILGKPVVLSPRGSLLPWALSQGTRHKQAALTGLGPLLRRVAGWHVTSEEEAQALSRLGCVGKRAIVRVVENGVAVSDLLPAPDRTGSKPKVVMLGRIDPIKGLDLALCALLQLRKEYPGAELVLAGPDRDGYGAVLREEARRLGVAEAVRFTGLLVGQEKRDLLRGGDLLWLCSHMESFGNVVIEALAAGTPVVAVDSTPWRWLEEVGVGRWVAKSPQAVATASVQVLRLLEDPVQREGLRLRCREAVAARFSWPEIAARMGGLYDDVLGGPSPSGPDAA